MIRFRAAMAAFVLVTSAVFGAPTMASAADPVDEPGSPDPRNEPAAAQDFGALASSFTGAVVDNGLFQLGVNPEGHMNLPNAGPPSAASGTTTVGLRYLPENHEVLAPGCLCEGWGIADRNAAVSGWASEDYGVSDNLTVVDFGATEVGPGVDVARSVVEVGEVFRVRHDFAPSPFSLNLYEILVTVENISANDVEMVYRRKMDWDVEPTHFNEFVTIGGSSDFLEFSSNDGFADPDPLTPPTSIGGITGTFEDAGPDDHGGLFDFAFGTLEPGASRQFQLFYGAAPNEEEAIRAVGNVAADVWSFGQPNISDGPDSDTLLDGREQGKPNTFIFAFASPDQCDEQNLVSLPPTAGGRVSVQYDPRFAAPDADPDQEEWSKRIAQDMQDRADSTLDEYEALGFQVDNTPIELRIECDNVTGRDAFVESSSLVHFRSHAVRTWFSDKIRLARAVLRGGNDLPDRGFPGISASPTKEWVNILDHELGHTWQYIEVVPEIPGAPLAFWLDYFTGNQTIIESTAVLSQDLVADADDLDPPGVAYVHSYLQFARQFFDNPDSLTSTGGSEYRKAAAFQYWAERWAQPTEIDAERRAALLARDLVSPFSTGTPAMNSALSSCGADCPDLYGALRDFYLAAYAHDAPNVTPTQNASFEILDSAGQDYPAIDTVPAPAPLSSGSDVDFPAQALVGTQGRVYEVEIGANISEVDVTLTKIDSGVGQGFVWAIVPFAPNGDADFASAVLTPHPTEPETVAVTSGGRVAVIVVASQPLVPWDDEATFNLEIEAPAIISGMSSAAVDEPQTDDTLVTTQGSDGGVLLLATPRDSRLVTINVYASDPAAAITVRRIAESGAEVAVGTYTGGATFDDGPLDVGRYLYEATADVDGSPVLVYSRIVSVGEDVTAPHAWLELAGRAAETNDSTVRAFIGGLSEPVTEMRFALSEADLETASWVPFESFSTVDLAAGDGVYRVHAQVRDSAGNESEVLIGEALLDTASPQSTAGPLPATTSIPDISVPFTATDAASFVQYVEVWLRHRTDSTADWGLWTMVATPSSTPVAISLPFGEGIYEFYTAAVDAAGNREAASATADASVSYTTAAVPSTSRVSVSTAGDQGNAASGASKPSAISDDGRYVAFLSDASNLVAGDTNGVADVFVRDRQTGGTTRVSVASTGGQANALSANPAISGDGRYVSFASSASTLVAGDTNGHADVFVHDRQTGATARVSVASAGTHANGASSVSSLSDDARYVTFASAASNLVNGDTNNKEDVFVRDRQTGATTRLSVTSTGVQGTGVSGDPAISDDGRYVAFMSDAKDLVQNDGNRKPDIFVHDRQTGATTRVSVLSSGQQANAGSEQPAISGDGRYVAFVSFATNLVANDTNQAADVFVHDRQTGETSRVSVTPDGGSPDARAFNPSISDDGRYVGLASRATNLVAGSPSNLDDAYVRDRHEAVTVRVSIAEDGSRGNSHSGQGSVELSGNGQHIVFDSVASNLVANDTNGVSDAFVRSAFSSP